MHNSQLNIALQLLLISEMD